VRTVKTALAAYKKAYPVNHQPKSVAIVNERSAHLERILGALLMPDLTAERITTYMADRLSEGTNSRPVSNRTVNMELAILSRAVGHTFKVLWPSVKKLQERHDVGRALSVDEEQRILDTAMRNKSKLINPILRLALITGMRRDEIRTLRWDQIDFEAKMIRVGKAKTEAGRGRSIPMGPMLQAVMSAHAAWFVKEFGPLRPEWYAFPFSNRVKPVDPTRPIVSVKKSWETVREKAGVDCRFHDLRHTVCTKMAEAGIPEGTMLAIMGHMSRAMLERYSHIRKAAKVDAMAAIELRSPFPTALPQEVPTVADSSLHKVTVTH
jgi:integrase